MNVKSGLAEKFGGLLDAGQKLIVIILIQVLLVKVIMIEL
jgi:hypothetical protein